MSNTKRHPDGFYIKSDDKIETIPLDCPVCELSMRDQQDIFAYRNFKCCTECKVTWAEPNYRKWASGWRPPAEKISKYREDLLSRPSYLVI